MARKLNSRQLAFIKVYLGGDTKLAGNATKSYRSVYGDTASDRSAQVCASKLLNNPLVKAQIDRAQVKAVTAIDWNARTVLEESVRLYDRCMGDTGYPVEYTYKDKKTGELVTTVRQERSYNPQGARAALELIGRNTAIQAFQDNIEVSHTHHLELALAKRAKSLEGMARSVSILPARASSSLPAASDPPDHLGESPPGQANGADDPPGRPE
ncbi:MAG: terminase small subunit [Gammaproteobacteria bacterium]